MKRGLAEFLECPVCFDECLSCPGDVDEGGMFFRWEPGEECECQCGAKLRVSVDNDDPGDGPYAASLRVRDD